MLATVDPARYLGVPWNCETFDSMFNPNAQEAVGDFSFTWVVINEQSVRDFRNTELCFKKLSWPHTFNFFF